jgi:hypothetical protein
MLASLKRRFAPSDKARQNEVLSAWISASRKPRRGVSIIKWIHELELAYDKAVEYKLPEVQGLHAHYALTAATIEIATSFSYDWDRQLIKTTENDLNKPSFKEMIQELRELKRLADSRLPAQARHGAFPASFQGMDPEGNPIVLWCICGEQHRYAACNYLIPERRPTGWKPVPSIQKKVDDAMASMRAKPRIPKNAKKLSGIKRAQEAARNSTTPNPTGPSSSQLGA